MRFSLLSLPQRRRFGVWVLVLFVWGLLSPGLSVALVAARGTASSKRSAAAAPAPPVPIPNSYRVAMRWRCSRLAHCASCHGAVPDLAPRRPRRCWSRRARSAKPHPCSSGRHRKRFLPRGKRQRAPTRSSLKPVCPPARRVLWPAVWRAASVLSFHAFESLSPGRPRACPHAALQHHLCLCTALACDDCDRTARVGWAEPRAALQRPPRRSVSPRPGRRPRTHFAAQRPAPPRGLTRAEAGTQRQRDGRRRRAQALPSLLVRKPYIGDYNHAILSSRASGTGNSARSAVYADGILLSNYLGNGVGVTCPSRGGASSRRKRSSASMRSTAPSPPPTRATRSAPWWTT